MWLNPSVQKTFSLLLLIGIGILLRTKIKDKASMGGMKVLILSIALPATIFVALLKIKVELHLLFLPVLALVFNVLMLALSNRLLPILGFTKNSPEARTLMMLFASLAPGLSCFPFLVEYLGEETLALAALTDVGNKVFVLILLYLLAMHWYNKGGTTHEASGGRIKGLLVSLVKEPINMVIFVALSMLFFGFDLLSLPMFMQSAVTRMSAMMTPLILLFIGVAVKIKKEQLSGIFSVLAIRSGLAFLMSGILVMALPNLAPAFILLAVAFPQSACSFWPYAHMAAVESMEEGAQKKQKTFDTDFALAILACSLPISTVIILCICSMGNVFTQPSAILLSALVMLIIGFIPKLLKLRTKSRDSVVPEKMNGTFEPFKQSL